MDNDDPQRDHAAGGAGEGPPREELDQGKKIVQEYAASLLPKGAQLSWKPQGAFWYSLISEYSGRTCPVLDMEIQDLEDIPGDEDYWAEMKAFVKDAIDDWKGTHLRSAAPS